MKLSDIQKQLLVGYNGKLGKSFKPSVTINVAKDGSVEACFFFVCGNRTTRKYTSLVEDFENFDERHYIKDGSRTIDANKYESYRCIYLKTETGPGRQKPGTFPKNSYPYINLYYDK